MTERLSRRAWLAGASVALGTAATVAARSAPAEARDRSAAEPFGYCLNTSTIDGQKLTLAEKVEVTAKAGYQAIEPWVRDIDQHVQAGGSVKELGQRLRDNGLTVESAIAFPEWIVDDDTRRHKALEEARRSMDLVAQLGGKRIAAPPAGATGQGDLSLLRVAERYRTLLELGEKMGVVPEVELWGFSRTLGRLSEAVMVAVESGRSDACILPDVYHLYKGGSDYHGLRLLAGTALHVIHFNDYPATPRASITDAQRVYPGDGVAPLPEIVRILRDMGFRGFLSLELFNRDYWNQDPLLVARTGLEKMRRVVHEALKE